MHVFTNFQTSKDDWEVVEIFLQIFTDLLYRPSPNSDLGKRAWFRDRFMTCIVLTRPGPFRSQIQ